MIRTKLLKTKGNISIYKTVEVYFNNIAGLEAMELESTDRLVWL